MNNPYYIAAMIIAAILILIWVANGISEEAHGCTFYEYFFGNKESDQSN